jgi:hypothetical protein
MEFTLEREAGKTGVFGKLSLVCIPWELVEILRMLGGK